MSCFPEAELAAAAFGQLCNSGFLMLAGWPFPLRNVFLTVRETWQHIDSERRSN